MNLINIFPHCDYLEPEKDLLIFWAMKARPI